MYGTCWPEETAGILRCCEKTRCCEWSTQAPQMLFMEQLGVRLLFWFPDRLLK